jgi:hypothetical protein
MSSIIAARRAIIACSFGSILRPESPSFDFSGQQKITES